MGFSRTYPLPPTLTSTLGVIDRCVRSSERSKDRLTCQPPSWRGGDRGRRVLGRAAEQADEIRAAAPALLHVGINDQNPERRREANLGAFVFHPCRGDESGVERRGLVAVLEHAANPDWLLVGRDAWEDAIAKVGVCERGCARRWWPRGDSGRRLHDSSPVCAWSESNGSCAPHAWAGVVWNPLPPAAKAVLNRAGFAAPPWHVTPSSPSLSASPARPPAASAAPTAPSSTACLRRPLSCRAPALAKVGLFDGAARAARATAAWLKCRCFEHSHR